MYYSLFDRPIHGLIFLFKWVQDDEPSGPIVQDNRLDKIFFAKQVCLLNSYLQKNLIVGDSWLYFDSEAVFPLFCNYTTLFFSSK